MKLRAITILSCAAVAAAALAGCSGTPGDSSSSATDASTDATSAGSGAASSDGSASSSSDPIRVVASTNVWGDLAAAVGGDAVTVTSIIDDPDRDPHEYEADARNQLALSDADVVIENGGGYDDFMDTMLGASDNAGAVVINAVEVSGKEAAGGEELNEHVWYDFPTVQAVIDDIESSYAQLDPDAASTFSANAEDLRSRIDALITREGELERTYAGESVAITEPVPLYLLEAIGLVNATPDAFSEAIEEDTDVAPAVLQETLALFSSKAVSLLAYNEQTTGPQTEAVLAAANENGIPVVPVTETLPSGTDYVGWMSDNLDAIAAALGG